MFTATQGVCESWQSVDITQDYWSSFYCDSESKWLLVCVFSQIRHFRDSKKNTVEEDEEVQEVRHTLRTEKFNSCSECVNDPDVHTVVVFRRLTGRELTETAPIL